jgi:hypothetical protein
VDLQVDTSVLEKHTVSIFRAEDSMFFQNNGIYLQAHMKSQPRRPSTSGQFLNVLGTASLTYLVPRNNAIKRLQRF